MDNHSSIGNNSIESVIVSLLWDSSRPRMRKHRFFALRTFHHMISSWADVFADWGPETMSGVYYGTIQYSTIQYNTIQYNTTQYNTLYYTPTRLTGIGGTHNMYIGRILPSIHNTNADNSVNLQLVRQTGNFGTIYFFTTISLNCFIFLLPLFI